MTRPGDIVNALLAVTLFVLALIAIGMAFSYTGQFRLAAGMVGLVGILSAAIAVISYFDNK